MKSKPFRLLFLIILAPLLSLGLGAVVAVLDVYVSGYWDQAEAEHGEILKSLLVLLGFSVAISGVGWLALVVVFWSKLRDWSFGRLATASGIAASVLSLLMWREGWALTELSYRADALGLQSSWAILIAIAVLPAAASATVMGRIAWNDSRRGSGGPQDPVATTDT